MFNNRKYLRIKFLTRHKLLRKSRGLRHRLESGGGGGDKGKFCTHNKRFLKNALLLCKKVGAMTHSVPLRWRPCSVSQ